jgi:hypothetical protein
MVYQYTFGDKYKSESDKKDLERAQIKSYQDSFIDENIVNKTLAMKYSYPHLSTGLISSLVATNASPEQVTQTAIEQEKINAQRNTDYSPLNTEYVSALPQLMLGKAFGTIGQGVSTGLKDFLSGGKRTLRFALQLAQAAYEETVTRPIRTGIMLAKEVEEELINQGLEEKEAERISHLYNALGILPAEAERRGLTNALGKLLTRKKFAIPDSYNEQKVQRVRKQAGGPDLEQTLKLIAEEAEITSDKSLISQVPEMYKRLGVRGVADAYDKFTGEGFIAAGEAVDLANEIKEANLYNNRTITGGRYISDLLGIENERADFWVSGIIDAATLMALDPANLLNKPAKALQKGNEVLRKLVKLQKAGKLEEATDLAQTFIKEDVSDELVDFIINDKSPDKFLTLVRANKDPIFAKKLYDANTKEEVFAAYEEVLFDGTVWNTPSFNGTKVIPDWLNNASYKKLRDDQAAAKAGDPLSTLGKYVPQQEVNLDNLTETMETFINFASLARVEKGFANKIALELTDALANKKYGLAQKILVKDFYGHLINKYAKNNQTKKSYQKWSDKTLQKFQGTDVAYTTPRDGAETRAIKRLGIYNGKPQVEDIPFPYQTMSHTFYFTDFRDVKRTVNTLDQVLSRPIGKLGRRVNSDTPLGKFLDEAQLTLDDLDLALPETFTDLSDWLWGKQMAWSTAMLPTRLAYPTRLTLEGLFRGYLYGLDSLGSGAYFEYLMNVPEDILGRAFKEGGFSNRQLQGELEKALGVARTKIAGPKALKKAFRENFELAKYNDEIFDNTQSGVLKMKKAVESLRIQFSGMWQDDITQLVSDYTVNNKSLNELADRFWSGDKKELWDDYLVSLDADEVTTSAKEVLQELQAYQNHILNLTGGNSELLESFITGVYKKVDMRSFDRKRTENIKAVTEGIEDMLRTAGGKRPTEIPTPLDLKIADNFDDWLKEQGRKGFQTWQDAIWYFASSIEANAIRIPFYKQLYFRKIAEDVFIADEKALTNIVGRIKKLPKSLRKELYELHPELRKSTAEIQELVQKNNLPKLSLEALDLRAQTFAKQESDRIFYNLSNKGLAADTLRFTFPFFEAFKEVGFSMLKGIRQKPGAATKVTHGIKAGRNEGIIYKDPLTEDDYVAIPIPGFMANKILGEGASKLKPYVTVPLSGFNLVGATLLPGVGPVVGVLIGAFSGELKKIFGRDTYKIIVPYGTPIEDLDELSPSSVPTVLGRIFIPSYLKSLLSSAEIAATGNLQSIFQQETINSRALDQVKIVGANTHTPLQTEEQFREFDRKVVEGTAARLLFEGIIKSFAPSPPRLIFQTPLDIQGEDVGVRFKPFVDAVIADMDLGKIDIEDGKHYVGLGVLSLFYSELQQSMIEEFGETDGPFYAWLTFSQMTGVNSIEDLSGVVSNALSKQGKYDDLVGKSPRTREDLAFAEANPEIVEKYDETYLYLMSGISEAGELEPTLFFEQIRKGDKEAIDPIFFMIEAQEFLFNICYESGTKMYRGDNSQKARDARNNVLTNCREDFPFGDGRTEINYEALVGRKVREPKDYRSRWVTKMNELEQIAFDDSLENYEVQQYIKEYFQRRNIALINLSNKSKTYTFPENKKELERQLATGNSDIAQYEREQLREVANILISENADFAVVYDEVLSYEIQYNKRYKVGG